MLDLQRDILPYLTQSAGGTVPGTGFLHEFYSDAKKHKKAIEEVFGDKYPKYLNVNRPREREEHKKYREEVFNQQGNPFRGLRARVVDSLDYIRQADDFDVQFPTTEVNDELSLKAYTSSSSFSPEGGAINWWFKEFTPVYVNDPNAVFLVLPQRQPLSELEYAEPRFMIIPSENVWMHRKGRYTVLLNPEKHWILDGGIQKQEGVSIIFLDHDTYSIARQTGRRVSDTGLKVNDWEILGLETVYDDLGAELGQRFLPPFHYCTMMPAKKVGKKRVKKNDKGEEYYESILADALPYVRKAQQNDSDIVVELNFHIASQEWRRASHKCNKPGCQAGVIIIKDKATGLIQDAVACPSCKGTGFNISGSGLDILWVTGTDQEGFNNPEGGKIPPGAPGGYIPRSIEPLAKLVEELRRNTDEAYSTINMQFIRVSPLDTSGTSKRYDREEFYRELNTQGDHILEILEEGYRWADALRFAPSGRAGEQVPEVLRPVRFNLENAELTREELNNAKDKKYDSSLVSAYELKMLQYTTGEQSDSYQRYVAKVKFDPYRTITYQEKLLQTAEIYTKMKPDDARTIRAMQELYFSINFDGLVSRALREDPDFWVRDDKTQYELLQRYNLELMGDLRPEVMPVEQMPKNTQMTIQPGANLENVKQTIDD